VKIGGKLARSEFRLIKKYKKEGKIYSLLEIELKTGRTHQIRVHMSYMGWPLWGDWRYGGEKGETDRLFLEAFFLEFNNPDKKKKRMKFKLPLAMDLKKILENYEEI
ncbi:RNA pseudouridine synthase, partial [Patescibacteria group bacterium]|nr:RNA pseudouridine synthase [Patescibacteria group bacterium]